MRKIVMLGALLLAGCSSIIGLKEPSLEEGELPDASPPTDAPIDMPMTPSCPSTCTFGCDQPGTCREGKLWLYLSTGAFLGNGLGGVMAVRATTDSICRTTANNTFPNRQCAPTRTHAVLHVSGADSLGGMKALYQIPTMDNGMPVRVYRANDEALVSASWDDLINSSLNPSATPSSEPAATAQAWSGADAVNTCQDWTSAAANVTGTRADTSITSANWLRRGASACSESRRLLCVCWAGGQ